MSTHRKGPAVADTVTVRNDLGEERQVPKAAVPFFVNQGFKVLDSAGRVSASATAAAKKESN